ncbi:M23 family metallopeptidase [Herbiconiux sp. KACC 21604]|uniref:M23 family metallopeptidase n=1 Tax=unclassified Herbiconiux TaxID=2618217 RepID=UPI0014927843|nr:M23 family metallopeptidase [Herbiconiux sp. SALV-R1]QJU54321.1 M23 family metallopeptidase [Herbiconiux sp. SALV-R1]WPO85391.1 M23 family metallopeptidase [Herbiconiux sp. KACC 21604]
MTWSWPVDNPRVTDEFGWRTHPIYGDRRLHRGIDLSAYTNQPVYSASAGWVSFSGYNGGEGNSVHINHPDGSKTKYFHNTSIVRGSGNVGDHEHIARAGTTGASTGTHVHFETHTSAAYDSPVDPRGFMAARGAPFGSAYASGGNATPITPEEDMPITEEEFARIKRDATQAVFDAFLNPATVKQPKSLQTIVRGDVDDAIAKAPALHQDGMLFQAIVGRLDQVIATAVRGGFIAYRVEDTPGQWAISIATGYIRHLLGEDREKLVQLGLLERSTEDNPGETVIPGELFTWLIAQANKTRLELGLEPVSV